MCTTRWKACGRSINFLVGGPSCRNLNLWWGLHPPQNFKNSAELQLFANISTNAHRTVDWMRIRSKLSEFRGEWNCLLSTSWDRTHETIATFPRCWQRNYLDVRFCYCCLRWRRAAEQSATRLSGCPVKRVRPAQKTWPYYLQDATPPAWTRFAFCYALWCIYFDSMCVCVCVCVCVCLYVYIYTHTTYKHMHKNDKYAMQNEFFPTFCTHTFTHLDCPWFIFFPNHQM